MRVWLVSPLLAAACSFSGGAPGSNDADGDAVDAAESGCGDGVLDPSESCDDANVIAEDGCSASCTIEPNFECSAGTCSPVTGISWTNAIESSLSVGTSPGGNPYEEPCANDEVVIGFDGGFGMGCSGAGDGVARLRSLCGRLRFEDATGAVDHGNITQMMRHGVCMPSSGFVAGAIHCPVGTVMTGIRGNEDSTSNVATKLEAVCIPLFHRDGTLGYGDELTGAAIGDGPVDQIVKCDVGSVVVGVSGGAGQLIDRLHVQCAPLRSEV